MSSSTKFRFYLIHFSLLSYRFPFFLLDCGMIFGNVGLKKPRFSALPDQMAANFRKLGIQKFTMIHDIFNWKPDQQPSSRKPCRLWNNPSIKILLKPRVFTTTNGRNFKRAPENSNKKARTDCRLPLTIILHDTIFYSSNRNDENYKHPFDKQITYHLLLVFSLSIRASSMIKKYFRSV